MKNAFYEFKKNLLILTSYVFFGIILYSILKSCNIEIDLIPFAIGLAVPLMPSIMIPLLFINFASLYFFKIGVNLNFLNALIGFIYSAISLETGNLFVKPKSIKINMIDINNKPTEDKKDRNTKKKKEEAEVEVEVETEGEKNDINHIISIDKISKEIIKIK